MASSKRTRIAFGSCNKHDLAQPAWSAVAARQPHMWAWLGDIVYADRAPNVKRLVTPGSTIERLQEYYAAQKQREEYQELLRSVPQVVGVYDDHDYGVDDAHKDSFDESTRTQSMQLLMDFLEEPIGSERRQRAARGEGVHGVWVVGTGHKRVKVILLDNRSHRDHYEEPRADMLGEAQWQWLERTLLTDRTPVTVIGSGLQVLARGNPLLMENWSRTPHAQARLLALLSKTRTTGAFFISGDVHFAEINRVTNAAVGYPLYDITSSGLTHSWGGVLQTVALHATLMGATRVQPLYSGRNWGEIDVDWAMQCTDPQQGCESDDAGGMSIDYAATNITFRVWGVDTQLVHIEHRISLQALQPSLAHSGRPRRAETHSPNGRPLNLDVFNLPLLAAVPDCASWMGHNVELACDRVAMASSPGFTAYHAVRFTAGNLALITGAVALVVFSVTALVMLFKHRASIPGKFTLPFVALLAFSWYAWKILDAIL